MTDTIIFDAERGYGAAGDLATLVDCTVVRRGNRWWMFACGALRDTYDINIFSAALPEGAPSRQPAGS